MAFARAKADKERERLSEIESKLNMKILKPGDAVNFPKNGDSIQVHYRAYLTNGTCIDDSYARAQTICFILGAEQVLKGWEMAIPVLSRGEIARITLTPDIAYGEKGYPPIIPPKSKLVYELELVSFSSVGNVERLAREKRYNEERVYEEALHEHTEQQLKDFQQRLKDSTTS